MRYPILSHTVFSFPLTMVARHALAFETVVVPYLIIVADLCYREDPPSPRRSPTFRHQLRPQTLCKVKSCHTQRAGGFRSHDGTTVTSVILFWN
jgi:hypothetical protein